MIDATFVDKVVSLSEKPVVVRANGLEHIFYRGATGWERSSLPVQEVAPAPLTFGTLNGLASYVSKNLDKLDPKTLALHVRSPRLVDLVGPLFGAFNQRFTYASASLDQLVGQHEGFSFGQWIDHEQFVIQLQSRFVETKEQKALLAFVGNIRSENVRQLDDDGVTQSVTSRAGAVMKAEVVVPNPVTLAPYRTFREVQQPESRFILRLQQGEEGGKPELALFEADGSTWRVGAISLITAWLTKACPTGFTVYS